MDSPEQIKARVEAALPGVQLELRLNPAVPAESSLVVAPAHAVAVARFLRDDPALRLDYCSNVTGVDWLDATVKEKVKTRRLVAGEEQEVEETIERKRPGYLEVVYHLYSVALRHGPVVLRQRTRNRFEAVQVASLTPVWRSCEFQEREVFDLFGVVFHGHPDLRRILMWDQFQDFPMRKDYVEPDDYEYEPTPHDEILDKARRHYPTGGTA
ncbi:MAG: NADH-quinone oxidoreductase subunit C [Verrucomicrobia bacterium]|jgi:NADH-quinone oxidoreductase subunit C|nr:NADH-quinone oxidoreductase subunit C [Verrucomicrobiota bacterium]